MQATFNRSYWMFIGKAFVQQWTSYAWYNDDDVTVVNLPSEYGH